jgi:NarL family two-component system sensor histidine kinase LiaS
MTSKISSETDGTVVGIAPIVGQDNQLVGALVIKTAQPNLFVLVKGFLEFILVTVTVVTIIAAIAGSIFGYVAARGITQRLKRLSVAADRWGHGDFTVQAQDTSEDEIGQMARQLNRMAEQLQNLLETRQKLATLEERNRLARDLHDSVKQQIFAVSMQIGATKVLLKRDIDAAEKRLNESEKLVHQAQRELTSLIRELRPVALEGKGLVAALRELATEWSQQTNIVANVRVEGTQGHPQGTQGHAQGMQGHPHVDGTQETSPQGHPQGASLLYPQVEGFHRLRGQMLPLTVEEALFRVAQEALSNVSRHSQATLVQMVLTITDEMVTLAIVDNGQGFDTTRQGRLGVGLRSMQERMKALGGDVEVESSPGKGTRVVAFCNRLGVETTVVGDESEVSNSGVGAIPFNEGV